MERRLHRQPKKRRKSTLVRKKREVLHQVEAQEARREMTRRRSRTGRDSSSMRTTTPSPRVSWPFCYLASLGTTC
jgi:hypothetical protein